MTTASLEMSPHDLAIPVEDQHQGGHLEVDEQSFEFSRFSLTFVDPDVEKRFSSDTLERSINLVRAYSVAGILVFLAYSLLDLILASEITYEIILIRYLVVCPILMLVVLSTYFENFKYYGQFALSIGMLAAGLGVIAMTAVMPAPFSSQYYAGLIMVVIYCSSLIRLKFLYGLAITIFLVLSYQFCALILNPIPVDNYISNNFFLITASTVGIFSSYIQELYFRRTYISGKILETKNEYTNVLLRESQQANRSKDQFLANMSHELRTPLNAIIGFSEILKQQSLGPLGNDKYGEYAEDINLSGERLLDIINDILDLVKANAGNIDLRSDKVELGALLRNCMQMCENRAKQSGVTLEFSGPSAAVYAIVDERLMRQIILNLLSNALKFSNKDNGRVKVSFTASPYDGIEIRIEDNGIGISSTDIQRVLRPFEQVESAYARKTGGAGLGLPLAAKLTELHNGKLTIDSKENEGTTVHIHLPPTRMIEKPNDESLRAAS